MVTCSNEKDKSPLTSSILLGILFISLLGSMLHFIYDFSGKLVIVGIIAPINESVWEHLKLAFLPTILWWALSYIVLTRKNKISFDRWFFSAVVALIICPLFIVSFYYTYTGALGFQSLILDISSLFLGVTIAQLAALHVYQHAKLKRWHFYLAALLFIGSIVAFIAFTFDPPHFPLFMDSITGKYGL